MLRNKSGTSSAIASRTVRASSLMCSIPIPPDPGYPCEDKPNTAFPDTGNSNMDNPCLENRLQLNKQKNPEEPNTYSPSTEGFLSFFIHINECIP